MKQNLFLNSVLNRGAILGFVMLCSHIFEQCAVVYGGTMPWFTVMGFEMLVVAALYIWMLYKFAKQYSKTYNKEKNTFSGPWGSDFDRVESRCSTTVEASLMWYRYLLFRVLL